MFDLLRAPARLPQLDRVLLSRSDCRTADASGDAAARIRRACPGQLLSLARDLGSGRAHVDGPGFVNPRSRHAVLDARSPLDRAVAVTVVASTEPATVALPGVFPVGTTLVKVSVSARAAATRDFDWEGREDRDMWARALFAPAWEEHVAALGVLHAVASYYVMAVALDGYPSQSRRRRRGAPCGEASGLVQRVAVVEERPSTWPRPCGETTDAVLFSSLSSPSWDWPRFG